MITRDMGFPFVMEKTWIFSFKGIPAFKGLLQAGGSRRMQGVPQREWRAAPQLPAGKSMGVGHKGCGAGGQIEAATVRGGMRQVWWLGLGALASWVSAWGPGPSWECTAAGPSQGAGWSHGQLLFWGAGRVGGGSLPLCAFLEMDWAPEMIHKGKLGRHIPPPIFVCPHQGVWGFSLLSSPWGSLWPSGWDPMQEGRVGQGGLVLPLLQAVLAVPPR